ncbi:zf-TFIIB domain-containing protein [Sphingomonas sp. GCM10030256]|uniref:TFIIB-type zinc ribbon-containing protein n=1 Tax=Sphingomonas sp. GCM10030256 TaxID=3273427 RepID=UPI00361E7DDF
MQCPSDGTTLQMSERSGIEIDYCPQCRGVWLDRGELDKIIERNNNEAASAQPAPQAPPQQPQPQAGPWDGQPGYPPQAPYPPQGQYSHGYGHKPHKRRKSFLEELFD